MPIVSTVVAALSNKIVQKIITVINDLIMQKTGFDFVRYTKTNFTDITKNMVHGVMTNPVWRELTETIQYTQTRDLKVTSMKSIMIQHVV